MAMWFDLAAQGFHVGAERLGDGVPRLLLLDVEDKADAQKLLALGFKRMAGSPAYDRGLYYLDSERMKVGRNALGAALGLDAVPVTEKTTAQIASEFREAFRAKVGKNLTTAINQSIKIGANKAGNPVFDSPTGRFMQRSAPDGRTQLVAENSVAGRELGAGMFLFADDAQSLADCADGFFGEIRAGTRMDWRDLERYTRAGYARHLEGGEVTDGQLRAFQEAVEAAGYRSFFNRRHDAIDRRVFNLAVEAYNGLPVARMRTAESIALQQYSTPLPMGVIAQRLLVGNDALQGRTVLEPTAGNGGLLTMLNTRVNAFAIELDGKRAGALQRSGIDAFVGDAVNLDYRKTWNQPEGFDYSITNPPFGEMERDRSFDLLPRVKRVDYYIALKTLEARKDGGRSVLILGGDDMRSVGTIRGGTKHFLEYVYDTYNVIGAVELDGRMYSKQGATANVRMLVVGERRAERIKADIPEKFDVLRSYDEAWDWSETLLAKYPHAPLASPETTLDEPVVAPEPVVGDELVGVPEGDELQAGEASAEAGPAVERSVNEFQAPYQSASQVAPPTGMIPINMAASTYGALAILEAKHGPVDEYVATKLQYRKGELGAYFSPEQVDALGLAISKVDGGRAFTNADMTGFGKGRFAAAMIRYAKLEGKVPVFLTISPQLFTDIFRDLSDIGSAELFKKPFIFNDGVPIMRFGSGTEVLHPATSPGERKAALDSGTLPEGCDLVLASYSQFQRRPEINRKSGFLAEIAAQGTSFVVDEAHVAAGESNISAAVGTATAAADSVIFASATPFKGAANFHVYGRMFPPSVDLTNLPDTLKAGGEALMEAISANMARDGVLVRREQDLSKLTLTTREPSDERRLFNRQANDQVADILQRMAFLSGDVRKEVQAINDELKKRWELIPEEERTGQRMQANSMNFGSRLYNINRQFLLSLVVEEAAQEAIDALDAGRKPVIAVENTGESLLREVIVRRANVQDFMDEVERLNAEPGEDKEAAAERIKELTARINAAVSGVRLDKPPQFRDLLEVMLDRIGAIKTMERYGVYSTSRPESEGYDEEEGLIREAIQALPDMPLSPLDVINQRLREKGYTPTEVSGRHTSLTFEDGAWRMHEHKKANAVANVAGFQNGEFDCITITRAGSTGISLHATNRFEDSDVRQREFIVAQKAANIAEFLQWMGRVNRRDQVSYPVICSIETALPAESRITMMHNAKLRRLSANTTSNRDNVNMEATSLDLLNDVGDAVALEWLTENPSTARSLDIDLPTDAEEAMNLRQQEAPYINKLMGRLVMLKVEQQEDILATLTQRFAERIQQLESLGINPFKVDVYEWGATVSHVEELVSPTLHLTDSTFDEPVKIVSLRYEEDVVPIRQDRLVGLIENGLEAYKELTGGEEGIEKFRLAQVEAAKKFVTKQLPDDLREKVTDGTLHVATALNSDSAKNAQRANSRMQYLVNNWQDMKPGAAVAYNDLLQGKLKGYITDVRLPKRPDELTLLGAYEMKVVFPGESKPRAMSLATLYAQEESLSEQRALRIDPAFSDLVASRYVKREFDELMGEFNEAQDGRVSRSVNVLSGNIYRAVELASTNNLGFPILYTDDQGNRQRAILLRSHVSPEKIKNMPMALDHKDVIQYMARAEPVHAGTATDRWAVSRIYNNAVQDGVREGEAMIYRQAEDRFALAMPGTKKAAGALMGDGRIFNIGAKTPAGSLRLELTGTRTEMRAQFPATQLPDVLQRLQEGGHFGKFYVPSLNLDVIKDLQEQNRQLAAQVASQGAEAVLN